VRQLVQHHRYEVDIAHRRVTIQSVVPTVGPQDRGVIDIMLKVAPISATPGSSPNRSACCQRRDYHVPALGALGNPECRIGPAAPRIALEAVATERVHIRLDHDHGRCCSTSRQPGWRHNERHSIGLAEWDGRIPLPG